MKCISEKESVVLLGESLKKNQIILRTFPPKNHPQVIYHGNIVDITKEHLSHKKLFDQITEIIKKRNIPNVLDIIFYKDIQDTNNLLEDTLKTLSQKDPDANVLICNKLQQGFINSGIGKVYCPSSIAVRFWIYFSGNIKLLGTFAINNSSYKKIVDNTQENKIEAHIST